MAQYYLDHKEFGRIVISVRRGMVRASMRWKDGQLHMSVPPMVSQGELLRIVDRNRAQIAAMRQTTAAPMGFGTTVECILGIRIHIENQDADPTRIIMRAEERDYHIRLPERADFSSPAVTQALRRTIDTALQHYAPQLAQFATAIFDALGTRPASLRIGRGARKLGHCTARGDIMLSHNVLALNHELATLIVCHELAHLSHMDHSAQFHAQVNAYLLRLHAQGLLRYQPMSITRTGRPGRPIEVTATTNLEYMLERDLKRYHWPIPR